MSKTMRPLSMTGRPFGLSASRSRNATPQPPPKASSSSSSSSDIPPKRKGQKAAVIEISDSEEDIPEAITVHHGKGKAKATELSKQQQRVSILPNGPAMSEIWADQFAPTDLSELAVHKRKVADVRGWLTEALENPKLSKYRRLLVLSGSAGTGKTATIRLLCQDMGVEIIEFRTGKEGGADSLTTQFQAFLSSSASVPGLGFSQSASHPSPSSQYPSTSNQKRLILVEDLPNIFTSTHTRESFRSALERFVHSSSAVNRSKPVPMVLIVSETTARNIQDDGWQASGWSRQDEGVSVRNLVPLDVLKGGRCTEIRFNPVALTIQTKGLSRILEKAVEEANRKESKSLKQRPSGNVIKMIAQASNGDLRCSINMLQFLAQQTSNSQTSVPYEDSVKGRGTKRKRNNVKSYSNSDALAVLVAGREASLFIFHALGKVLYSKRWGESPEEDAKDNRPKPLPTKALPKHLEEEWARKPSKVDVNDLFADAPVDNDIFSAYLHQNYPNYTSDLDQCANAVEYLSMSDSLLRLEGETFSRHPATSQYSFQVSVRGMLLSLPSPVPRKGQKIYKADIWEHNRQARENEQAFASLVPALARQHRPANQAQSTPTDAQMQMNTRRVASLEIIPHLKHLLQSTFVRSLPPFATALVQDLSSLAILKATENTSGVLDEHDIGGDDDNDDEPSTAHNAEQSSINTDDWFLDEDDIDDHA